MMFCPLILNKLKKMQESVGNIVKTTLYEGRPTKLDLTAVGMGTAYLLSTDNVLSASYAQNIHYEGTANGETFEGVMDYFEAQNGIATTAIGGVGMVMYDANLGGSGFAFRSESGGVDRGEITLKLWTEYNPNVNYILTPGMNIDQEMVVNHLKTGNVCFQDGGYTNLVFQYSLFDSKLTLWIAKPVREQADLADRVWYKDYTYVNGVYQTEST